MNEVPPTGNRMLSVGLTRRGVVASMLAAGAAPLAASASARQRLQTSSTPEPTSSEIPVLGEAAMPAWRFIVSQVVDPYTGEMTRPESVPDSTRIVAIEVVLFNESNQPLDFSASDFRLRDTDGVEYRAGDFLGTEPRVVSQNLPQGERTRGWTWFGVPEDTELATMVFIAPPPVLQIELPG